MTIQWYVKIQIRRTLQFSGNWEPNGTNLFCQYESILQAKTINLYPLQQEKVVLNFDLLFRVENEEFSPNSE